MYWNKRNCDIKKSSVPTGLAWDAKMASALLFFDTNMAAVKLCEKTLLLQFQYQCHAPRQLTVRDIFSTGRPFW